MSLLFDPLFRIPLFTGLLIALILPVLGCYLRLRGEWLVALGIAHVSTACHLLGIIIKLPVFLSGGASAVVAVALKQFFMREGNEGYALMILTGWATLYLLAANSSAGEAVSHALTDGQLYFASTENLIALTIGTSMALLLLPYWNNHILRARLFPAHESANNLPAWKWHVSFDLMSALLLALAIGSVGLMGAFSLVFLPPWIAFQYASGWKSCLIISLCIGVASYLLSFILALHFDQPFGPVLVAVLLVVSLGCMAHIAIKRH